MATTLAEPRKAKIAMVVGGMAVSTLLTLFVVPAAYSLLDDVVQWNADRRRRGQGLGSGLGEARASLRGRAAQWRAAHVRARGAESEGS